MNLHLSEDQRMLRDAAQRFLSQRHPVAVARAAIGQDTAARHALWRDLAEQGWPALLAPDTHGGLGLGMREAWIVAEEAGRHLLSLPLVANMALLPTLCHARGVPAGWTGGMMAGDTWYADAALRPDGSAFIEGACDDVRALAVRKTGAASLRLMLLSPVRGVGGLDPTMPVAVAANPHVVASADIETDPGTWEVLRTRLRVLRAAEMLGAASAALDIASSSAAPSAPIRQSSIVWPRTGWRWTTRGLRGGQPRPRWIPARRPRRAIACSRRCWPGRPAGASRKTPYRSTARWESRGNAMRIFT